MKKKLIRKSRKNDKPIIIDSLSEYKKSLTLTSQQKNVIIGTLLGDSSLSKVTPGSNLNSNIKFDKSIVYKDYVQHLYNIFNSWCGTAPRVRTMIINNTEQRDSIWFRTYRHEELTYYHDLFYLYSEEKKRRIKKLPISFKDDVNGEVLAYWFMDSGDILPSGYRLNTQKFTFQDNEIIKQVFKEKFNIETSFHKDRDRVRIYIGSGSRKIFTDLIKDYIVDDYKNKLHIN